jgi:hypothetical protein
VRAEFGEAYPVDGRPHGGGGQQPDAPPGYGEVRIDAPDFTLYARLHDAVPTPTTPGGWGIVERPLDVAITDYAGREPRREAVAVMFDDFQRNVGIERDLERLESLLEPVEPDKDERKGRNEGKGKGKGDDRPDKPKRRARPPVFIVRGGIHLAGRRVVLESIEWGVAIRRPQDDKRIRQAAILGLLEFERPDRIKIKRKRRKVYITKQGDTLKHIAKHLLGKAAKLDEIKRYAEKIGKLNKIRDINRRLNKGKRLQLP